MGVVGVDGATGPEAVPDVAGVVGFFCEIIRATIATKTAIPKSANNIISPCKGHEYLYERVA